MAEWSLQGAVDRWDVPEALYEVSIQQAEAETSQACKDAIGEGHHSQPPDVPCEEILGVGFGDSKNGC